MSTSPGDKAARAGDVRVCEVGRKVRDFPAEESLSTPENAYATFNRYWASGDLLVWRRLSVPRIPERMQAPAAPKRTISPQAVESLLDTEVVEVRIWREDFAMVFGRFPRGGNRSGPSANARRSPIPRPAWARSSSISGREARSPAAW